MNKSVANRLLLLFVAAALLLGFLVSRTKVKVEAKLTPAEVKDIVSAVRGHSLPMFFQEITIQPGENGLMLAYLKESETTKTAMVFTNAGSGWKATKSLLLGSDTETVKR